MTTNPTDLTIAQATKLLKNRTISATELAEAHLQRIEALEPRLQCHITLTPEVARAQAVAADRAIASGEAGPLAGIPISIKDVLCTVDADTTAGSKILEGFRSPYDATVITRLRAAGAVFVGKGNTDEFAMGSSTENSAFFPTRNPWNTTCVPGGSSGGPAAAVAAGEAICGIGSDTGGSIRSQPCFCASSVSNRRTVAFLATVCWRLPVSLDQIGPFTRRRGCRDLLKAIAARPKRFDGPPRSKYPVSRWVALGLRGGASVFRPSTSWDGLESGVESSRLDRHR